MRTRTRYKFDRVTAVPLDTRPATWTFAGTAMRGTETSYVVTDGNLASGNRWEFIVRVPADARGRIEVRPKVVPPKKVWGELTDRSLTFMQATLPAVRGKWYCQVAFADVTGEKSKSVVSADDRGGLPHWFAPLTRRMRRKEAVRSTKGTDGNALVVLVKAGDHVEMIRLFFATKVWVLAEGVVVPT
jgi:hypothetical protein